MNQLRREDFGSGGEASWGSGGATPRTLENFRKVSKDFLRKLQKCIILAYFPKIKQITSSFFVRFDEKHKLLRKFEKFLKMFDKIH